jgi:hypothetical protein
VVEISIASANAQIIKRIGIGTTADISHNIVDIRKPCAYLFASVLAVWNFYVFYVGSSLIYYHMYLTWRILLVNEHE